LGQTGKIVDYIYFNAFLTTITTEDGRIFYVLTRGQIVEPVMRRAPFVFCGYWIFISLDDLFRGFWLFKGSFCNFSKEKCTMYIVDEDFPPLELKAS